MANIKSAKKRILVTETKAARNKAIKSGVKTAIKKVEAAVAANDKAAAEAALKDATSAIASAGSKGRMSAGHICRVLHYKKLHSHLVIHPAGLHSLLICHTVSHSPL